MTDQTQEPSLTERLAAKLYDGTRFDHQECTDWANDAHQVLPPLLSEPELVASLPDEVRLELLRVLVNEQYAANYGFDGCDYAAEVWGRAQMLIPPRALTPEGKDG